MFILDPLYYIYKKEKRETLLAVSKKVAQKYNASQACVIVDMVWCAMRYGAMWTEYGDLDFYQRSAKNRETYITTFFNFKLYDKLNDKRYRNVFHEKITFLETFSEFIKRDWIKTDDMSDKDILNFLDTHKHIVAKASYGDSGKEVEVIEITEPEDLSEVIKYLKDHKLNLIEEQIVNCDEIRALNRSSLNTFRIVTVKKDAEVNILFAGIRVGSEGAKIDNISQGGRVARIDITTGRIDSPFFCKASSQTTYNAGDKEANIIGFQIPMWGEVIDTVKKAALVVPEIRIVAWDIAITPTGIDIVEGNESFGSVIMQLYYDSSEAGLKPRLLSLV